MAYDPVKAHDYYERTKKLKGRKKGASPPSAPSRSSTVAPSKSALSESTKAAVARISRLESTVSKLEGALSEAQAALSAKRQAARKTAKENSDGKSTEAEKQASQKYRDKHKQEIAAKSKSSSSTSGGGTSSSSSHSVSDMSVDELESRIINIRSALTDAKRQLSNARQQAGQLAHSDLTSEPSFNTLFAQLRSEERIPSK